MPAAMAKRKPTTQLNLWPSRARTPRANSRVIAEQLFADHERWAAKVAIEMHARMPMFDRDDLVQEAKIGLWRAACKYNAKSPVRFPVFAAKWVKGEILMATRRGAKLNAAMETIEGMENRHSSAERRFGDLEGRLSAASLGLLTLLEQGFTIDEIAAQSGVMTCEVEALIETLKREAGL